MTAAIVTYQVKSEQSDEFSKEWRDKVAEIEGTPGLGPLFLLLDSEGKKFYSVAFWESEEQARNWSKVSKYTSFIENVRKLLTAEPVREYCELSGASPQSFLSAVQQRASSRVA